MEKYADLAFECILLPSTIDSKVLIDRKTAVGVLKELMNQLSTVTKTQLAANNEGQSQPPDVGSLKKKAYIQLMVIKIFAYLEWDVKDLSDTPSLQLLLLETLLLVLDTKKEFDDKLVKIENARKFTKTLYCRWVLKTAPLLNYPTPPGNKAQIFNAGGPNIFSIIDPPTATVINTSSAEALKTLNNICEEISKNSMEYIPSKNSFKVGSDVEKDFLPEVTNNHWIKMDKDVWTAQILGDLVAYYLFTEEYDLCRTCIEKLKKIDDDIIDKVLGSATMEAYETATRETAPKSKQDKPLYQKINDELSLKYKGQQKQYETSLLKNTPARIEAHMPFPHSEEALKKADLKGLETFIQYLNGHKSISYGKPPNFNDKTDRSKSKPPKNIRKRDLLLTLMREKRPDKIMKLIQVRSDF